MLEKVEKKSFMPKCPCCILRGGQAGNLLVIMVFDQRGILMVAKTLFPVKAKLWVRSFVLNPETSGKENIQKKQIKTTSKKKRILDPLEILSLNFTITP